MKSINEPIGRIITFAVFGLWACGAKAEVSLPSLFSDHMVLQRSPSTPIWGTAEPGETVAVSFNGRRVETKAGADGKWMARLNLEDAPGTPFEIRVGEAMPTVIRDVAAGEVWLAGGQSNMDFHLAWEQDGKAAIASSSNASLRFFQVEHNPADAPQARVRGRWVAASPKTCGPWSAVAYYFANRIQSELRKPVGVIQSCWVGTPCEAWTSLEALDTVPALKNARVAQRNAFKDYPAKHDAFVTAFERWLQADGREDRPEPSAAGYVGDAVGEGWKTVNLPGVLASDKIAGTGALWMRREVEIPPGPSQNVTVGLHHRGGYPSVYWNGKLIQRMTFRDPMRSLYHIPAAEVRAGRNTLAVRFFAPAAAVRIFGDIQAGTVKLNGPWQVKAEYELPPLDARKLAAMPVAPANPPQIQNIPAYLYNGMIRPLIPYGIRGVIWYQGEANTSRAFQYRTAFPLMIRDWRTRWGEGNFPFYFCQLANFMAKKSAPSESKWAELREAQHLTLKEPNTGEAVLIDLGEAGEVHFLDKKDAGERLARIALARDYGKNIPFSGPVFKEVKVENGKIRVDFEDAPEELVARPLPPLYEVSKSKKITAPLTHNSPGGELEGFTVCGADQKWVWANAKIEGKSVVVWSDQVSAPVAVRYGWADNPTCNLYNTAGLPASPFRSDSFPLLTQGK